MQRPFEVLEKGDCYDLIMEKQSKNLKSALAYGALTTNQQTEKDLYETIVEIPHYQCKFSSVNLHYLTFKNYRKIYALT